MRREFVSLALLDGANISELCRRFGVSRVTAYKWIDRYLANPDEDFVDRCRRPLHCPNLSSGELVDAVLSIRAEFPAWGGRKIRAVLAQRQWTDVPSASTITQILRRANKLGGIAGSAQVADRRFERDSPNELWQMDFKGPVSTLECRCHVMTLIDDHSRFSPGLLVCRDQRSETVKAHLESCFRTYGMPYSILSDRGTPWYGHNGPTRIELWLLRLGIKVLHGRPYHPQTQGKVERLNRTLKAEVLEGHSFRSLEEFQQRLANWRITYNTIRGHDSLESRTPITVYQNSPLSFPETLAPVEYGPVDLVRKVQKDGWTHFKGKKIRLSDGLVGMPVGFRAVEPEGLWEVRFCSALVAQVNLRHERPIVQSLWGVNHVSERL